MTNRNILTGIAGAAALWLGFPNDLADMPPLVLLWPVALALLGLNASGKAAALRAGWLCGLCGGAAALYWLALPVHDVGGLPWPPAALCALFIAACLSCANGLFSCAALLLRDRPPLIGALALALAWYLLEHACARLLGFPWLPLAGALAAWPLLVQAADLLGAYALGGLWTLAALLCLAFSRSKGCLALGLALAAALTAYGAWRLGQHPFSADPAGPESVSVLIVEGNIDQNQKWIPAFQQASLDAYIRLTRQGLAAFRRQSAPRGENPLIVWPETALPFFFEHTPKYDDAVRELAADSGCPLLLGAPGLELAAGGRRRIFNRAFLLAPAENSARTGGRYDKTHLVPFGEYLPDWLDFDFLRALLQGVGVYEEGKSGEPLRYARLALGMLICYEGIFPWLAEDRVRHGANILADISNDAWFGDTPAARQHLYLTALRAVEQGRWLLRGTNTGISAVVDNRGRLTMRGGQFTAGTHFARAALLETASPYSRLAPWIFPAALAAFALLLPVGRKGRNGRPHMSST
ncbi:MAG: apolipoprotein N-acyltransferase [Desulfovibrio sp.]|jgi:apolipoprotein N-acyltransferase|nr:apolipoprotein N-acyltransferase [Desulfovibrio sp.]